jgi:hypothetical protein
VFITARFSAAVSNPHESVWKSFLSFVEGQSTKALDKGIKKEKLTKLNEFVTVDGE